MSSAPSGGTKPPSQIPRSSANKSNKSKVQKISLATRASAPGAAPKAASGEAPLSTPEPTSSSPEHQTTPPSLDSVETSGTDGAPSTPPTPTPAPTAVLPTLDFSASSSGSSIASPDGAPQQQTGAKSAGESLSSNERQRRFLARMGMGCVGLGLIGAWLYQGREWGDEEEVPKGVDVKSLGRIGRANARISEAFDVGYHITFFADSISLIRARSTSISPHGKNSSLRHFRHHISDLTRLSFHSMTSWSHLLGT